MAGNRRYKHNKTISGFYDLTPEQLKTLGMGRKPSSALAFVSALLMFFDQIVHRHFRGQRMEHQIVGLALAVMPIPIGNGSNRQ